ncbi:hypothetical protein [Noviherbaspirillum sp.]|jgi:hypothetical protein|uniref:hypothetical protein n=1 Tax=Noviherbaspirillum sp. TaxID=1926288 RepID=UPI0025EEBF37|nr:hypothetical protein [Noviherbaspirillum sp.]
MAKATIAAQPKAASFTDMNGAAMTIPVEQLTLYARIKTEQLAILNGIIADKTAGFKVELTDNTIATLAGLASELAHINNELVLTIADNADNQVAKGAAR